MGNPFHYGGPVVAEGFIDREEELRQLARDMTSAQKVFLISPRRYGKTSLLLTLAGRLRRRGCLVAFIDLFRAANAREFLSLLSSSVLSATERRGERALRLARKFLPQLRPRFEIGINGTPSLTVDIAPRGEDLLQVAEDVLGLPERLAARRKRPFVVLLDECQEIARFDGDTWEKKIRALIQHHRKTGYVFSGSSEHVLKAMIGDRTRAFYRMGRAHFLGVLPREKFARFIRTGFEESGVAISPKIVERILSACDEYPYNVQYMCHVLWSQCQGQPKVSVTDLDEALHGILEGHSPVYATMWESFTAHQRSLLKALAAEGGEGIFSNEMRQRHNLGPSSTVDTALKSLIFRKNTLRRDEDGQYVFYDVFFREWIRRRLL